MEARLPSEFEISQLEISPLKLEAPLNILLICAPLLNIFHELRFWLKLIASSNIPVNLHTFETSHPLISWSKTSAFLNMKIVFFKLVVVHDPIG